MKTARAWSVRPSVLTEEWEERDRVLAEALIEFEENAYCPGCGQLKSKAWDEATSGSWQHSTVKCYACADHAGIEKSSSQSDPGVLRFMTLNEEDVRRAQARKSAEPVDLDAL